MDERVTDQNTLVRTALPHLGQHMADMDARLGSKVDAGFDRQDRACRREFFEFKGDFKELKKRIGGYMKFQDESKFLQTR